MEFLHAYLYDLEAQLKKLEGQNKYAMAFIDLATSLGGGL
jgi:hypothetical protein